MKNSHKVSSSILFFGILSSHHSHANDGQQVIHRQFLEKNGIPAESMVALVQGQVLLQVSDSCYVINPAKKQQAREDLELKQWLEVLGKLAGETTSMRLCEPSTMPLATQDIEPIK